MMRGAWCTVAVFALLVSLPASPGLAQVADQRPEVTFETDGFQDLIVPLGDPGLARVTVHVGCDPLESPQTWTTVHLRDGRSPDFANLVIAPATLHFQSQPGDCPATGTVYAAQAQVSLALHQNAPAFTENTVELAAMVYKQPPEVEEGNRSYGPYTTNLSYTPGYFNLYNVRMEDKILQANAKDAATYEATIDNFSNDETRFSISVAKVPEAVDVTVQPRELVLQPNKTGTFQARVQLVKAPGALTNEVVTTHLKVTSATTNERATPGAESEISMLTQFQGSAVEAAESPGPGAWVALALVCGVAAWRAGRQGT